jgi:hypothetical protein
MRATDPTDTPLDTLRHAFAALLADPCPLVIPADELPFLTPTRDLSLPQAKALLLAPATASEDKRTVWAAIVRRSQQGDSAWTVAAAGLAYPALAGRVLRVCRAHPGDVHEIQAEILVEFLTALKNLDVEDPGVSDVAGYLAWRALNASQAFRRREAAATGCGGGLPRAVIPLFPAGHPDIVLARAVRADVITREEAEWISRTCLGDESAAQVAKELGMGTSTFYRRRTEAGHKLAAAIESGDLRGA